MKKKVLVCGASGFIGRNIYERLSRREDLEVFGTYRTRKFSNEARLIKADLTDRQQVDAVVRGMDAVIQAAAVTSGSKDIVTRPYIHITDNVIMNALLLQSVFDHGVSQFLFPSSTVVYQPNTGAAVREEDVNFSGIHEKYFGGAWMKLYIEKLCQFYAGLGKARFTIFRHANMYGPYDKFDLEKSHVFGASITKIMTAPDNGTITVWGKGEETRDLLYIDDLLDFIEQALNDERYTFDIFNVGAGSAVSVRQLVEKMIAISDKRLAIHFDTSKPNIPTKLFLDINKAERIFKWRPKITLDEGIKKTMAWYQEHIQHV